MIKDLRIVRKQVKQERHANHSAEIKLSNLVTLKLLRHLNIVELLGSYIFCEHHNFLFSLASGGNLASLLDNDERLSQLLSDESIFLALKGLSLALKVMYYFTYTTLDLKMIGCHRDLKP